LATLGEPHPLHPNEDDIIKYTYNEPRSVYLRLMPTAAIPPFDITKIMNVVTRQRLHVMSMTMGHKPSSRNPYGAVAFLPHGNATTPVGLSQIFRSGEIWGLSTELIAEYPRRPVVHIINLQSILANGLYNYIEVARDELGIAPSYQIEIGVTGMRDVELSLPDANAYTKQTSNPIFDERLIYRATLKDVSIVSQNSLIHEFLRQLYDLAGVVYHPPRTSP
jgi:hypothetical protein